MLHDGQVQYDSNLVRTRLKFGPFNARLFETGELVFVLAIDDEIVTIQREYWKNDAEKSFRNSEDLKSL